MNPASLFTRVLQQQQSEKRKQSIIQAQQQQLQQQQQSFASPVSSGSFSASSSNANPDISEEMAPFHSFLLDMQQVQASSSFREEQLFKFFTQLRHSSPAAQLQALDLLSSLIAEKPSILLGCSNLLSLILRILQSSQVRFDHEVSDAGTAIYCKLFWLISSTATEHLNVKDLKRLFRILRRVVEKKSPPVLCRLMLSSLADMAAGTSSSTSMFTFPNSNLNSSQPLPPPPSCCFDFSGTQSALALPPLEKFTASKGYTVCFWIRFEAHAPAANTSSSSSTAPNTARPLPMAQPVSQKGMAVAANVAAAHPAPNPNQLAYLYSFLTDKGRGIEGLIGKTSGNIVIRSCSRGVLQELNTEVRLMEKRWYFLAIVHRKPQTFSRSSGTVSLYLNEELSYEGELSYPQLPDPLVFNAFAAATHPSKPSSPFIGRLATISFHNRPLQLAQIQTLYRKGSDFCISVLNQIDRSGKFLNFVSNSISSLLGAISSVATTVAHTATSNLIPDKSDDTDTNAGEAADKSINAESKKQLESYKEIFKSLLCLYHPKCVENHLALDCSPLTSSSSSIHQPCHASILPGVQICYHKNVRDIIHLAIGGITCFFPLFQHLDVLSGGTGLNSTVTSSSASSTKKVGGRSGSMSATANDASPLRIRSQSSILPLVFRTLQLMLRDNAANQIQFLQVSGFQMVSYLLTKYASVYHLSEGLLPALEEMMREFSYGFGLTKLLAIQSAEDSSSGVLLEAAGAPGGSKYDSTNHQLPVSRAAEKTLFNDFFLHILLNFSLWFRTPITSPASPVASAGDERTSYQTASAALDDLSQHQVPFAVQFEVLMLIKSHVLKNPRYFRRLLSAGGGSGVPLNSSNINNPTHVHAGGASVGPVKFILDSLRRFINYQSIVEQYATVSTLLAAPRPASPLAAQTASPFFHPFLSGEVSQTMRNFRSMRKEWYTILQSMMLCSVSAQPLNELGGPVNSSANVVREADMLSLIQIISEVSEASASSATATAVDSNLGNNSNLATPNATNAHSWVLAEYLELLTTLLRARPSEVTPMLQRNGGLLLFTSILSRNVKHQHVQVAVIHLISSFFNNMMQDRVSYTLEQVHSQVTTVLANLQVTLSEVYFTVPTYEALLELSCSLEAGSLGAANAAEDAIERFCMSLDRSSADGHDERSSTANDGHTSPINFAPSGSPPPFNSNSTSPAPHSPSSVHHSIFTGPSPPSRAAALSENCTVQFPRVFELIHSLLLNNDILRTKEKRKMHENWNTESRKKAISRVPLEPDSVQASSSSSDAQRAASPMSPQVASGASTHRSSDNIHWDAEAEVNAAAAFTIHPPVAPFTLFHPSFNPVLGSHLSTLVAPLVSLAKFLSDLDLLLRNSPTNSQLLLSKWSMGLSLCFRELDWQGGVSIEETLASNNRKQENKEEKDKDVPATSLPSRGRPSVTASAEEEKMIAAKLQAHRPSLTMGMDDIDSFLRTDESHSQQRHHQSIDEEILNTSPLASAATTRNANSSSPRFNAPANDAYLQALFRQQLLADTDLALPAGSSSPVPLLASKIAETMLYHALVHVRDGWIHWRDALLLLRFEAEAKQDEAEVQREEMERRGERLIITEERFRAVRRNLLMALFRRLELLPQASLSASVASGATGIASNNLTLHLNLTHTIDLVEEMLYLDNSQRFKNLRFRIVDADDDNTAESSSSGNNTARKTSRLESVTRSLSTSSSATGGGESWVLMDEEENDMVSSSSSSNNASDPFAAMTQRQAIFFRQEWGLIRELLQCLVHLRFSLQPSRVNATGTSMSLMTSAFALNETGNTVVIDSSGSPDPMNTGGSVLSISSASPSSTNTSRTGGPLRVIVRLLLDCCSAICLSTQMKQRNSKQPEDLRASMNVNADTSLSELQDVVSSLGALVHVELDVSSFVNAQGHYTEKGASREWKNRSVLHILWKLCNIIQILPKITSSGALTVPEQMRKILLSTANQIVESLKPFAAVPFTLFDPSVSAQATSASSPYASTDRSVYVPLVVNEEGVLDIDPTFQLPILTKMVAPRSASGSVSNSLAPPISPTNNVAGSGRSSPAIPTSAADAVGLAAASSPLYPRILRACQEYVNSSAQLFHSLAVRFANDQQAESTRVERLLRQRFKERDSGFGASTSNRDAARASWRSVQTFSYSEANRRAVADSFYADHIARNAEQWRILAHDLYSEGSAWCSSELASRRKFYRIDAVEDGYRMRRKIRVFLDAADHHQATQSYIEHARTIAMLKEKEKKQKELAAKKREDRLSGGGSNSANNPVTPTVKRVNAPTQSSLHTSTSSPSLSATASAAQEAGNPDRAISLGSPGADAVANEIDSLSLEPNASMTSAMESAATEERAEIEQLEKLNELGKSLGGLKSAIDEEEDAEADAQDEESKDDVDEERKDGELPTGKRRQKRGSFEDEEAAANEEEDRLTSLPRSRKSGDSLTALDDRKLSHVNGEDKQKKAAEANQDEAVDWDMCEVPNASSPGVGSSGAAPSLTVPSFNPASIYTSPFVTLVLPIGTIYGTLEISPNCLKFSHNPHAEEQLLQKQMIMTEQLIKQQEKDGVPPNRRVDALNPPPKSKPFSLPSLDALRARARKDRVWPLNEIVAVYRRRYQLQKTALEIFLLNGKNYFLEFGSRNERKLVLRKILGLRPPRLIRLCSRSVSELLARSRLTEKWVNREMSTFEYLMHLNTVSGRTYNDLNQYAVFPWVISYYPETKVKLLPVSGSSKEIYNGAQGVRGVEVKDDTELDIEEIIRAGPSHKDTHKIFRDLTKPMGALDPQRLEQILERFNTFFDSSIPPFHYGSHYSNAAIVLFYLMRLEPYASLHIELQAGKFDWADRLFYSLGQTWKNCCTSLSCYKELTPEFFYSEVFLDNINRYDLGTKQDGQIVDDVMLPTWANHSSAEFIRINRLALESEYVSQNLHHWIDLIFGYKQKGQAAKDAHNLFFHLTYEGSVDLSTVKDPVLLDAIQQQVAQFGQTPSQLFKKPHPQRIPLVATRMQRLSLSSSMARLVEQSDYHHPTLRRVLITKDLAILNIKALPTKIYTASSGFVLGLHAWLPDLTSEIEDPTGGVTGNRSGGAPARKYALPFTYSLVSTQACAKQNPVLEGGISFTSDGRTLLEGNNWDDSMRVYGITSHVSLETVRREKGGVSHSANPSFGEMKLTLNQCLIQHHDRLTAMCTGRDEKTLVTASKDCTLLVWNIEPAEPSSRVSAVFQGSLGNQVRPAPKHILRGHEEPLLAVAVESELDLCVSVSARGQVLLHGLRKGTFVASITVPRVVDVARVKEEARLRAVANATAAAIAQANGGQAPNHQPTALAALAASSVGSSSSSSTPSASSLPSVQPFGSQQGVEALLSRARTGSILESPTQLHLPKLVAFAADGCMVFYSVTWDSATKRFMEPQLACCTVNARHWRAISLDDYLMCMCVSSDGKLIATGSEDGMLVLRRLHDLKVVQRFEPVMSSITSIAFSFEQEYLLVGTSSGHLNIFAVKC